MATNVPTSMRDFHIRQPIEWTGSGSLSIETNVSCGSVIWYAQSRVTQVLLKPTKPKCCFGEAVRAGAGDPENALVRASGDGDNPLKLRVRAIKHGAIQDEATLARDFSVQPSGQIALLCLWLDSEQSLKSG
jgi:hypothetical protein